MDNTNKQICLCLGSQWVPIGYKSVKDAILALCAEQPDREGNTALGLDIGFNKNEDGTWDFSEPAYLNPINWEAWENLEIRDFDLTISTSKKIFRVPTVILFTRFNQIPKKHPRPTKRAIIERDRKICQYSGKDLSKTPGLITIDHVISVDEWKKKKLPGSPHSFANMVVAEKSLNLNKGNRSNEEVGLKLIKSPIAPKPIPICNLITEARHFTWKYFLVK